jgi:hypothetical protein
MFFTYSDAKRALSASEFGEGTLDNILLDEVQCMGDETSLENCPHDPWRQHDCRSYEVAGVVCEANRGKYIVHVHVGLYLMEGLVFCVISKGCAPKTYISAA